MIVVITSCAPTVAFSQPAIAAHSAPARDASTTAMTMCRPEAMFTNDAPTQVETRAPTMYWPWPPMLKRPHLKAKETASPVRISVAVRISVCWRLKAASTRSWPSTQGKSQFSPVPLKIPRNALSGLWPVAAITTIPIPKAKTVVTSGITIPPARWAIATRAAAPAGGVSSAGRCVSCSLTLRPALSFGRRSSRFRALPRLRPRRTRRRSPPRT